MNVLWIVTSGRRVTAALAATGVAACLLPDAAQAQTQTQNVPNNVRYMNICKRTSMVSPVTGIVSFAVSDLSAFPAPMMTFTVAVGSCTPYFKVKSDTRVIELPVPGAGVGAITATNTNYNQFSYDLATRTAIVTGMAPGYLTLTFFNDRGIPRGPTGGDLHAIPPGRLKVCKVAGPGVAVGRSFNFMTPDSPVPVSVVAGTAPRGYCTLGPEFIDGSIVEVKEVIPPGIVVSGISVNPPARLAGPPDLDAGSVNVAIGSGITEVTFTDRAKSTPWGWMEICVIATGGRKPGVLDMFVVRDRTGRVGTLAIPAGSCSAAMAVVAGSVTVRRMERRGTELARCSTLPAKNQLHCSRSTQTSTIKVAAGDAANQTVAILASRS